MKRRAPLALAVLGLAALAGSAWWMYGAQGPRVVKDGEPIPLGQPVEKHFVDEESGEVEVWKLQKKEMTREEALEKRPLPEPNPPAPGHVPNESARTLDGLALEAWKQGDPARALELFEQAVAADPDDRVPRSHYGRLLTLAIDYERALPQLERAAELAPEDPQVWLDLQTLYERMLRLDQAWEARARAEERGGGRPIRQSEMGMYEIEGTPSFP